jgi:hypothetical protein
LFLFRDGEERGELGKREGRNNGFRAFRVFRGFLIFGLSSHGDELGSKQGTAVLNLQEMIHGKFVHRSTAEV